MKKMLAVLLSAVLILGCASAAFAAEPVQLADNQVAVGGNVYTKVDYVSSDFETDENLDAWNNKNGAELGASPVTDDGIERGRGVKIADSGKDGRMFGKSGLNVENVKLVLATGEFYIDQKTRVNMLHLKGVNSADENAENDLLYASPDGRLYLANANPDAAGSDKNLYLFPYQEKTWYKVDMLYNMATQTFDVYINDKCAASQINAKQEMKKIFQFNPVNYWGGSDVYVDNVGLYAVTPVEAPGNDNDSLMATLSETYDVTTVREDTFEGYSDSSELGWAAPNKERMSLETVDDAHGQSLAVGGTSPYTDLKEPLTGKILIKASYRFNSTSGKHLLFPMWSTTDKATKAELNPISALNQGYFVTKTEGNANKRLSAYAADTWYDVALVLDTESGTYDAYIGGQKVLDDETHELTQVPRFYLFNVWDYSDAAPIAYIDNVGIYTLSPASDLQLDVTMNHVAVDEMADLFGNATVTATLNRELEAGEEGCQLIFALYKDGRLSSVSIGNAANGMKAECKLPGDLAGYTLSAYLWDGFSTMQPAAASVNIQ